MTFGTLALVVAAGLIGPLVGWWGRAAPPIVVGEIVAGVVIGRSGFDWLHSSDPTLVLLSNVGLALLMFIVGTHLPVRSPELRPALGRGLCAALSVGVLALAAGAGVADVVGPHDPLVLAVLVASSSGAVALPILQAIPRNDRPILVATAWIAIADVATVLAIPLVLPVGSTARALAGGALVIAAAAVVYVAARGLGRTGVVGRVRDASGDRGWAVDLRIALLVLFVLAWIAERFGTSILLAGFASGVVVTFLGEPRRVAQQLIGIGEGFFVPLFFVALGAKLDLGAFVHEPRTVLLAAALLAATTVIHLVVAVAWRLPPATGMLATAQLGVPAAVASVGLSSHALTAGQASAVMAAAVGSLIVCAIGGALLGNPRGMTDAAAPRVVRPAP